MSTNWLEAAPVFAGEKLVIVGGSPNHDPGRTR